MILPRISRIPSTFVTAVLGSVLLMLVGTVPHSVSAQDRDVQVLEKYALFMPMVKDWQICGLRKVDVDAFTSVRPQSMSKQTKTATFDVDYSGFPAEVRAAFERAVDVWETRISSDVTIRIDASYESMPAGVLGRTTPNFVYTLDANGDGESDVSVVDALADALSGEDQNPSGPDFSVEMNLGREDWHFAEGNAPAGRIDFTSVVLHEIAHGLGYLEATNISGAQGQYGVEFTDIAEPVPLVYTQYVAQREGQQSTFLIDKSQFSNPSPELADALTSGRLVFDGVFANATAEQSPSPSPPRVYAPGEFNSGSSISHLDEGTYPTGSTNALMTPFLNTAETIRRPGPIVCGQLRDMLWPMGEGCQQYFSDVFALQFTETPDPEQGQVTLSWQVRAGADIQEYVVERKAFDGEFEPIRSVDAPPVTLDSLGLGVFEFRIRWTQSNGSEATTPRTLSTTFRTRNVTSEISSRDEQRRASVSLSWDVPPGTDGFTYQIERRSGTSGFFSEVASANQTEYVLPRQTPGRFQYRVSATNEVGDTVTGEETTGIDIDFSGNVYVLGPYPNPANETARFDFTAQSAQTVDIGVYNVAGERLYAEERSLQAQTPEFLTIDVGQWSSGLYFLRVRGSDFQKTRKMIVVK